MNEYWHVEVWSADWDRWLRFDSWTQKSFSDAKVRFNLAKEKNPKSKIRIMHTQEVSGPAFTYYP